MANVCMLGSGFIAKFYTEALINYRAKDRIVIVSSRTEKNVKVFAEKHNIPNWTTNMVEAINHADVDLVVVGLPNHLHKEAILETVKAGKPILCTKPLGRNGAEAKEILEKVENAGLFNGYMEDLVYVPKTMQAIKSIQGGAIGKVLWTRSREAHSGPHSDWFWDKEKSGGGAILDLACHCIELCRSYIGKQRKPIEVMCWADTQVHPIEAEDHAIGLIKFDNGAIGQFEVGWTFRGGLDLRDEVEGTEGTIWLNNFLRTGFEMFTAPGKKGYVAEKAESDSGWLYPMGDENFELGYVHMYQDMLNALEENIPPRETFYDGYVVNEIMDACLKSAQTKKWEPVQLSIWRGDEDSIDGKDTQQEYDDQHLLVKQEKMPDGKIKLILKNKKTGKISQKWS